MFIKGNCAIYIDKNLKVFKNSTGIFVLCLDPANNKYEDIEILSNFQIPEKLDAIVIGSGIGGMATAAIMSKSGKRVLVLEQHDQAGGCCHTFIDKVS